MEESFTQLIQVVPFGVLEWFLPHLIYAILEVLVKGDVDGVILHCHSLCSHILEHASCLSDPAAVEANLGLDWLINCSLDVGVIRLEGEVGYVIQLLVHGMKPAANLVPITLQVR